jgi:hypothetical protein
VAAGAQVLGKTVTYQNPSTEEGAPEFLTGMVDSVLAKDGQIFFMINDNEISMDSVTQIWAQSDPSLELLEDIRDQVKDLVGNMEMTEDEARWITGFIFRQTTIPPTMCGKVDTKKTATSAGAFKEVLEKKSPEN